MKVVMTLVVRDEADIVDSVLGFHLEAGVDFVIATDHASQDGTEEILRRYAREGHLSLAHEGPGELRQSEWVTRMARLAATDHGADWVLNVDADEFWWPRHGTLREIFAAVPQRFGVVRALQRHFAPRAGGVRAPFSESMVARHPSSSDSSELYQAQTKVAHRANAHVVVPSGNHDAYGDGLVLLREWFPIEVLHFPVRSLDQMRAKVSRRLSTAPFARAMRERIAARGADEVYADLAVDDERLRVEVAAGRLAVDVRLRDALRAGSTACVPLPEGVVPESALDAERAFVADVGVLMTTDAGVEFERDLGELDRRLARVLARRWSAARVPRLLAGAFSNAHRRRPCLIVRTTLFAPTRSPATRC